MPISLIHPQSLILPKNLRLKRNTMAVSPLEIIQQQFNHTLPRLLNKKIRHALRRQSENKNTHYPFSLLSHHSDHYTIIYDVFRTYQDKKIIAVCPSLRNLKQQLFPLTVLLEKKPVAFQYKVLSPKNPIFSTCLIEINMPECFVQTTQTLKIEFCFKPLKWSATLPPNPFNSGVAGDITLMTKQKYNPFRWIQDWCLYHHRVHKIKHILLYNYGKDTRQLMQKLSGLDPDLKITLVTWNFPFGVRGALSEFAYLNHAHYFLGGATPFRIVLDIDEYLVNPSHQTLTTYLHNLSINGIINLRIPGVPILPIYRSESDQYANYLPRVLDFPYQNQLYQNPIQRGTFPKTIFTHKGIHFVSTHFVEDDGSIPPNACGDYSWNYQINKPPLPYFDKLLQKIDPSRSNVPQIDLYSERKNQQLVTLDTEKLYYNHYLGLSTGWKNLYRLLPQSYNPQIHTTDPRMEKMLKIAKLPPKNE